MSGTAYSAPRCFVDIYPYEGGQYTISGNDTAFLNASVSKTITNGGDGKFQLNLAPGGPSGLNSRPTWLDVVTPFSLVVIGMRRAGVANIVMIGVVDSVTEVMSRSATQPVSRGIQISGSDFTALFKYYNYYNLAFQLSFGNVPPVATGLPTLLGAGLAGSPATVGSNWYTKIMTGTTGILHATSFAYKGARPLFENLMSTWFEEYPTKVTIPTFAPFIGDQGSWLDKFMSFFPFPWYEVFIQTASVGYYGSASAASTPVSMDGFSTTASPTLVCRVNPLPFLSASGTGTNPTFSLDMTRWNALPTFTMNDNRGSFTQDLSYSHDEVKNYYIFMPTWLLTQIGANNGSISPFSLLFSTWANEASVNRYGFRPHKAEVRWMADPTGAAAQSFAANGHTESDMQELVATLSLQMPAYCEPTPNMLSGTVSFELRPDIMPGTKFAFAPYRDGVQWTFYISAISHSVEFGGRATTTLTLSRGLPTSIYSDNATMLALCTGNAMRQNGEIVVGLPSGLGNGLTPVNIATLQNIMASPSKSFGTPRN